MAARWAVPDRIHRPTGLKGLGDSRSEPVHEPEHLPADAPEIERYLGNDYLAAVARGISHRGAAGGARRAGNADAVAGVVPGPASTPSARVQAKLVVGAAGDAFEREADRVADLLIRRAEARPLDAAPDWEPSPPRERPLRVSRQTDRAGDAGIDVPPDIAARVARLRGGGIPLPAG
jgi:hypothetical protein